MQMDCLKVFCDVARYRSFSLAAAAWGRTQSAVSQVVSQLEKRVGVTLVDRSTRPLQLTDLGQRYYVGCKKILEQYAALEAGLRDARDEVAGSVHVAAIYSVGFTDMEQYVGRFRADFPDVEVHLDYLHPATVYGRVQDGTADLGLVSFPRRSPKLVAERWKDEPMVVVCAPNHPLARAGEGVSPAQLDGQAFIHFDHALPIRREVDRFLKAHGAAVEVVCHYDTVENIKDAVAHKGVALLPEPTVRREVAAGTLAALPLRGANLVRPLGIIHRRRPPLSAAAERFLHLLQTGEPCPSPAPPQANGHAKKRKTRS